MSRRIALCLLVVVLVRPIVGRSQTRQTRVEPRASNAGQVTFTDTIAPIVYANCVTCHRPGEAGPFSLISYEDVAITADEQLRVAGSERRRTPAACVSKRFD